MASKYQEQHYEDVAELLEAARRTYQERGGDCPEHGDAITCLMSEFVALFTADSPLFDRERFLKACGLEAE